MYKALQELKSNKQHLTKQTYRTIRGQILAGDIEGGLKGLNKVMRKKGN